MVVHALTFLPLGYLTVILPLAISCLATLLGFLSQPSTANVDKWTCRRKLVSDSEYPLNEIRIDVDDFKV